MATFDVPYNDRARQAEWAPIKAQPGDVITCANALLAVTVKQELLRLGKTSVTVIIRMPTDAELLEPRLR